jgi:putative transposase
LKLPKLKDAISYRDDRVFKEKIKRITISKSRTKKYFASMIIEIDNDIKPLTRIESNKILGADMSAKEFLIAKGLKLSNPRFYRKEERNIKRLNKQLSRKQKGSKNRERVKLKLARVHEKIYNRRTDWLHKLTYLLSEHFDCVILEDLNIKGMQQFNSGISKSVTLDFSWNRFLTMLKYKMTAKGKHLVLVDRYFASSKLCSTCGYKNDDLELKDRTWQCPNCKTVHDRDLNASINIRTKGLELLKEDNNITVIDSTNDDTMVGTTINAFGKDVRLLDLLGQRANLNEKRISCL